MTELPATYPQLLKEIKGRIHTARIKAVLSVNRELIRLYWDIGRLIVERQRLEGWGKSVVKQLSNDIQSEFPGIAGFSPQNIWYVRSFYLAWTENVQKLQQPVGELDGRNLPQIVGEIPWGHNLQLLSKLKNPVTRLWYVQKTLENGWSRTVLTLQIESALHERQGQALTNFENTLPAPKSDLAKQTLKDPYLFDFLNLTEKAAERDLENALTENITRFLLELGVGFAFLGRQKHLEVEDEDFYIDLLFYHIHLHCYIVIDLKMGKFKPEYTGKMNFYLAAVDAQFRREGDAPSIGLILCKEKKRMVVEYALSETNRPMGVAQWQLTRQLPEGLENELPKPEEIEEMIKKKLNMLGN